MKSSYVHRVLSALTILTLVICSSVLAADKGKIIPPKKSYNPAPVSKASAEGKKLFEQNNCSLCHTAGQGGGCLAPPLNGVGSRRSREFIISRITDAKREIAKFEKLYGNPELMPHIRLPRSQSTVIADYLMTLPEPKFGYKVTAHTEVGSSQGSQSHRVSGDQASAVSPANPVETKALAKSIASGRILLSSKGCMACHSIGNIGGKFAPKFDHIGGRKSKSIIKAQMTNAELLTLESDPEYGERGTVMPPLNLTDKEADDIAAYLDSLK